METKNLIGKLSFTRLFLSSKYTFKRDPGIVTTILSKDTKLHNYHLIIQLSQLSRNVNVGHENRLIQNCFSHQNTPYGICPSSLRRSDKMLGFWAITD